LKKTFRIPFEAYRNRVELSTRWGGKLGRIGRHSKI
jgi:hypothetical protein